MPPIKKDKNLPTTIPNDIRNEGIEFKLSQNDLVEIIANEQFESLVKNAENLYSESFKDLPYVKKYVTDPSTKLPKTQTCESVRVLCSDK